MFVLFTRKTFYVLHRSWRLHVFAENAACTFVKFHFCFIFSFMEIIFLMEICNAITILHYACITVYMWWFVIKS